MARWVKILCAAVCSFVVLFSCVGYAAVSGNLSISGSAEYELPTDLIITQVEIANSTVDHAVGTKQSPTNVLSTITGQTGETVVYKITVYNYSPDATYVYSGTDYLDSIGDNFDIYAYVNDNGNEKALTEHTTSDPIEPGDELTFYARYTLTADTNGDALIKYNFLPVIYTITYMDGDTQLAVEYITDNSTEYTITRTATKTGETFNGWVSASSVAITKIPANNTNDYTLYVDWANKHVIRFVDTDGTILHQEEFAQGNAQLTITDAELNALLPNAEDDFTPEWQVILSYDEATGETTTEAWESYNLNDATSDVTVRVVYNYTGGLALTPVDSDGDGDIDYYQVDATENLSGNITVPGVLHSSNGDIPVLVVDDLCAEDSIFGDTNNELKKVTFLEGVEQINERALAYTTQLSEVVLPSSLKSIGVNAFASQAGQFGALIGAKQKITFTYNGTKADWDAIEKAPGWDDGLVAGSKIVCSDGYYTLSVSWLTESWTWTPNPTT